MLKRLSIQSKLMLMMLLVSIGSISIIAIQGSRSGKLALQQSIFQQLTSLRASRVNQLESYFDGVRAELTTLSENLMLVSATEELITAYNQLQTAEIPKAWDLKTDEFYQQQFLPQLAERVEGKPTLDLYRPFRKTTRYLQYHYLANNPRPLGLKENLDQASDGSKYSQVHGKYHPLLRAVSQRFEFYDLLLIDAASGSIVYSVEKEVDFGTSLREGPFAQSNLAEAFQLALKSNRDAVVLVDFETYDPSYGAPAAFLASPIHQRGRLVGVLAVQLSIDKLNRLMTSNQEWEREGLGQTGETYLVGEDLLMRSTARPLIENPEAYFEAIATKQVSPQELERIKTLDTSILTQRIDTPAVQKALAGDSGIEMGKDYRNVKVLTAFSPVQINGVHWVLLATIDAQEAFAPIKQFERQVLVSTSGIMLMVTLAALLIARCFVQPLHRISHAFGRLAQGETDIKLPTTAEDEFGQLIHAFNQTVTSLQQKAREVEEKNQENETLLHNILPDTVAQRLKGGEETIADKLPDITVMFANLSGFTDLSHQLPAEQTVAMLNQIVSMFDEACDRHGIEKIKTLGGGYMAACGLSMAQLDHTRRTIDFVQEMARRLRAFNRQQGCNLKLTAGIHSGPVVAGVVGRSKFVYDLWGETVNIAYRLHTQGEDNALLVTERVYERVGDLYNFESWQPLETSGGKILTWTLQV